LGAFFSLPSETNKYTHVFLASPLVRVGMARGDTEIEKYFDMSVVLIPAAEALHEIGTTITSMETVGAMMAARAKFPADLSARVALPARTRPHRIPTSPGPAASGAHKKPTDKAAQSGTRRDACYTECINPDELL
jgi:hypothetical protein